MGRNSNHNVGRAGEYLVAAELCRRGYTATTFSGNVPDYDIVAITPNGTNFNIQVKTSNHSSWQFDLKKFCEVGFEGQLQIIGRRFPDPVTNLFMVFVDIKVYREDNFYVMSYGDFVKILVNHYEAYLQKHSGERPKNFQSTHAQLKTDEIFPHLDKWQILQLTE